MIAQASCMKAVLRLQQYKGDPKKPSVLIQLKRQRLNLRKPWQLEFVEQRTTERRCREICREVPVGLAYICTCMWGNYPKPGKIYKERVNRAIPRYHTGLGIFYVLIRVEKHNLTHGVTEKSPQIGIDSVRRPKLAPQKMLFWTHNNSA